MSRIFPKPSKKTHKDKPKNAINFPEKVSAKTYIPRKRPYNEAMSPENFIKDTSSGKEFHKDKKLPGKFSRRNSSWASRKDKRGFARKVKFKKYFLKDGIFYIYNIARYEPA
jgi:hypothetical protein